MARGRAKLEVGPLGRVQAQLHGRRAAVLVDQDLVVARVERRLDPGLDGKVAGRQFERRVVGDGNPVVRAGGPVQAEGLAVQPGREADGAPDRQGVRPDRVRAVAVAPPEAHGAGHAQESPGSPGRRADVVPGHHVPGRPGPGDRHPVADVPADHVPVRGGGPADDVVVGPAVDPHAGRVGKRRRPGRVRPDVVPGHHIPGRPRPGDQQPVEREPVDDQARDGTVRRGDGQPAHPGSGQVAAQLDQRAAGVVRLGGAVDGQRVGDRRQGGRRRRSSGPRCRWRRRCRRHRDWRSRPGWPGGACRARCRRSW